MTYKLIRNSKGDRWMKDGKFVSAESVSEEDKQEYFKSQELEIERANVDKKCAVCGDPVDHKRMILGMTVGLCDNHYYSASYGAIAGILKKKGIFDGAH